MQKAATLVSSLIDKKFTSEHGIDSKIGTDMIYPAWVRDFFTLMSVTYMNLWDDAIAEDVAFRSAQRMWFTMLKDYDPRYIQEACMDAVKIHKFPPKPADLLEIVQSKKRLHLANEEIRIRDQSRMLPAEIGPPKCSRAALEAKLGMWKKLGMNQKIQEVTDGLSRMDSAENGNHESPAEIV